MARSLDALLESLPARRKTKIQNRATELAALKQLRRKTQLNQEDTSSISPIGGDGASRSRNNDEINTIRFQNDHHIQEEVLGPLENDLFTDKEAAAYLEISFSTLERYVRSGKLEPARCPGHSQMFATKALKDFKNTIEHIK